MYSFNTPPLNPQSICSTFKFYSIYAPLNSLVQLLRKHDTGSFYWNFNRKHQLVQASSQNSNLNRLPYIYLLDIYLISLLWGRHTTMPRRETRKEKGKLDQGRRRNQPPQPRQLMSLWGKKKKNRKQKEQQKKETGSGAPTQLPGPVCRLLRPALSYINF